MSQIWSYFHPYPFIRAMSIVYGWLTMGNPKMPSTTSINSMQLSIHLWCTHLLPLYQKSSICTPFSIWYDYYNLQHAPFDVECCGFITLLIWWVVFMGPIIDSKIKTPNVGNLILQTQFKVKVAQHNSTIE